MGIAEDQVVKMENLEAAVKTELTTRAGVIQIRDESVN